MPNTSCLDGSSNTENESASFGLSQRKITWWARTGSEHMRRATAIGVGKKPTFSHTTSRPSPLMGVRTILPLGFVLPTFCWECGPWGCAPLPPRVRADARARKIIRAPKAVLTEDERCAVASSNCNPWGLNEETEPGGAPTLRCSVQLVHRATSCLIASWQI